MKKLPQRSKEANKPVTAADLNLLYNELLAVLSDVERLLVTPEDINLSDLDSGTPTSTSAPYSYRKVRVNNVVLYLPLYK